MSFQAAQCAPQPGILWWRGPTSPPRFPTKCMVQRGVFDLSPPHEIGSCKPVAYLQYWDWARIDDGDMTTEEEVGVGGSGRHASHMDRRSGRNRCEIESGREISNPTLPTFLFRLCTCQLLRGVGLGVCMSQSSEGGFASRLVTLA